MTVDDWIFAKQVRPDGKQEMIMNANKCPKKKSEKQTRGTKKTRYGVKNTIGDHTQVKSCNRQRIAACFH
jgi:hypothetical protein